MSVLHDVEEARYYHSQTLKVANPLTHNPKYYYKFNRFIQEETLAYRKGKKPHPFSSITFLDSDPSLISSSVGFHGTKGGTHSGSVRFHGTKGGTNSGFVRFHGTKGVTHSGFVRFHGHSGEMLSYLYETRRGFD